MKKTLIGLFVFIFVFMIYNGSVSASTRSIEATDEIITDNGYTKYVLKANATEYSTIITEKIAWRSVDAKGDLKDNITFIFSQEKSEGYSFSSSITNTAGASVGIPGVGEVTGSVATQLSHAWNYTETFTSSVQYSIYIGNEDEVGIYQLQLKIPETKKVKIDGNWEKYTRTKFIFWSSWKKDTSFNASNSDEFYVFTNAQQIHRPYLDLVKVQEEETPPPPPPGGGGGGGGGNLQSI